MEASNILYLSKKRATCCRCHKYLVKKSDIENLMWAICHRCLTNETVPQRTLLQLVGPPKDGV